MQAVNFVVKDDDTEFMQKYPDGLNLSDLLPFYQAVARNDPLKLEWICHGKVISTSTGSQNTCATAAIPTTVDDSQIKAQQSTGTAAKLAEFDFDEASQVELSGAAVPVANAGGASVLGSAVGIPMGGPLRRVGGANRPAPRQPRVANMDKILNDFFRTRKESNVPTSTFAAPTGETACSAETSSSGNSAGQAAMAQMSQHVTGGSSVGGDSITTSTITCLPIGHLTVADRSPDRNSGTTATTADATADVIMDSVPFDVGPETILPEFPNSATDIQLMPCPQIPTSVEAVTHTENTSWLGDISQSRTAEFPGDCVAPDSVDQKEPENLVIQPNSNQRLECEEPTSMVYTHQEN